MKSKHLNFGNMGSGDLESFEECGEDKRRHKL